LGYNGFVGKGEKMNSLEFLIAFLFLVVFLGIVFGLSGKIEERISFIEERVENFRDLEDCAYNLEMINNNNGVYEALFNCREDNGLLASGLMKTTVNANIRNGFSLDVLGENHYG